MQKTGLLMAAAMVAILLAGGCTAPQPAAPAVPTVTLTGAGPRCGFTSCHGLDLACGPNPPEACTAIYELGDKCRQYAYCTGAEGSCRLVTTEEYRACRQCIETCGGSDRIEILRCQERC